MRIAMTGVTGFVGSHIAEAFVRGGHTVTGIVRRPSPTGPGITPVIADLDDIAGLTGAMRTADVVIHAAAKVQTFGFWREFEQTTIRGTAAVLAAATNAGVPRFVQISSVGVYGWPRPDGRPFDESDPPGTPYRWNYYARAKIAAEKLVRESSSAATIVRLTWVVGPRDPTTLGQLARALRDRRVRWIGDGTNRLDLVAADDMAAAVMLAATRPEARGQIYNINAPDFSITQREFITRICQILDLPVPTRSISAAWAQRIGFAGECLAHATAYRICPPLSRHSFMLFGGHRRYSSDKIRRELGWQPHVTFETAIRQAVNWYQEHA